MNLTKRCLLLERTGRFSRPGRPGQSLGICLRARIVPNPTNNRVLKSRPLSGTTEASEWGLAQRGQLRMVPLRRLDEGTAFPLRCEAAKNETNQQWIQALTPEEGEHMKIEKVSVVGAQREIMRLNRVSPQGPPITSQPVFHLDQPQRRPFAESLLHVPAGELGIPKAGNRFMVFRAYLGATRHPVHCNGALKIRRRQFFSIEFAAK